MTATDTPAGRTVDMRNYAVVTGAYWADTIADGAIRVLVLFYFYDLGYSPFAVASLFLFYELFGVITNLGGGYLAARFGLKTTLLMGLGTQIITWSMRVSIVMVLRPGFDRLAPESRIIPVAAALPSPSRAL